MKTSIIHTIAFLLIVFLHACSTTEIDEPTAVFTPDSLEVKAGSEITFSFSGDCDYVTFWSGEDGAVFENRHRIEIPVDSAYFQFNNFTAFGNVDQPRPVSVYISDTFKGSYTQAGIYDPATQWNEVTPANTPNHTTSISVAYPSGKIDLTPYKNNTFFIAFKFISDSLPGTTRQVRIKDFEVYAYTSIGLIKSTTIANAGFRAVNISGTNTWTNTATQMDIRGTAQRKDEDWFITKELSLNRVQSDRGIAIKTISENMSNFRYSYSKPGTYKAKLEIRNSRYGEIKTTYQDFTFVVK